MGATELNYDQLEYWLLHKSSQLSRASKLLQGKEISAVMLDPVGCEFPRDWYAHLLKYEPSVGLVKGSVNKAYVFPRDCDCDEHKAAYPGYY
jgi:hypothetical protein